MMSHDLHYAIIIVPSVDTVGSIRLDALSSPGLSGSIPATDRYEARRGGHMSPGEWWLVFGILASLLPAYLLVRTVLHVLNIPIGRQRGPRT